MLAHPGTIAASASHSFSARTLVICFGTCNAASCEGPDHTRREALPSTEAAASLSNAAKVKEKLRNKMSQDTAAYGAVPCQSVSTR